MSAALLIDSRPHSAVRSAVSTALSYRPPAPVTASAVRTVSVTVDDYVAAVAAGHRVVDIRTQRQRDADGIISGALAIDPSVVLDRLVPGSSNALRAAASDARWILVSSDGHDAEWSAWHLQAHGVVGTRFLLGGLDALRHRARRDAAAGHVRLPLSEQGHRDLAIIAAH